MLSSRFNSQVDLVVYFGRQFNFIFTQLLSPRALLEVNKVGKENPYNHLEILV